MGHRGGGDQTLDAIKAFGMTYGLANTIKDKWGAGNAAESATAVTEDNSGAESDARLRAGYVPGEVKDANGNTVMGDDGKPITNPATYDEFKELDDAQHGQTRAEADRQPVRDARLLRQVGELRQGDGD